MPQSAPSQVPEHPVGSSGAAAAVSGGRLSGDSGADRPLKSTNTMFWRPDPRVKAASAHPGWAAFHRCCGKTGLFFDDVEAVPGSRSEYRALAFRLGNGAARYDRFKVAVGHGKGPIAAVRDAFALSVAAGWPVDPAVAALLDDDRPAFAAESVAAPEIELNDLLGDPPMIEDWELA